MIARFADAGELAPADVLVVGAGAAGLAVAYGVARNGGDVLVVESGGIEIDTAAADLSDGESVGHPHAGLRVGRVRALGGTTKVWPGQCLRLRPTDLTAWALEADELAEPYRRAEEFLRCGPPATAEEVWRRSRLEPLPATDALDYVASTYARQRDLGARLRRDLEREPRIRVLLGATALRLSRRGDRVDGVELGDLHGRRAIATASRVVVAAGGIENPRLLLVSGLGGGAVGRFFHDHCAATVGRVRTSEPGRLADLFGMFTRAGGKAHVKLALSASEQQREAVLGCSASFVFRAADNDPVEALLRLRRRALRRTPLTGVDRDLLAALRAPSALAATLRRRTRGLGPATRPVGVDLLCIAEQQPDADSRISLSDRTDALGVPQARLDWRIGERERRAIEATTGAVDAWLRERRLGSLDRGDRLRTEPWREQVSDTFHHMGATRMAPDPRDGVVDANCRVHGLENLYVAGSSVFPTGGYANPTLTIVALALRLADHLQPPR